MEQARSIERARRRRGLGDAGFSVSRFSVVDAIGDTVTIHGGWCRVSFWYCQPWSCWRRVLQAAAMSRSNVAALARLVPPKRACLR